MSGYSDPVSSPHQSADISASPNRSRFRMNSRRGRKSSSNASTSSNAGDVDIVSLLDSPEQGPQMSGGARIASDRSTPKHSSTKKKKKRRKQAESGSASNRKKKRSRNATTLPPLKEAECGICFEKVECQGVLDSCNHVFCSDCIRKWAKTENTCPQCKRRFKSITRYTINAEDGSRKKFKGRKISCAKKNQRAATAGPEFDFMHYISVPFSMISRRYHGPGSGDDDDSDEDYLPLSVRHHLRSLAMQARAGIGRPPNRMEASSAQSFTSRIQSISHRLVHRIISRNIGLPSSDSSAQNTVQAAPGAGSSADPIRLDDIDSSTSSSSERSSAATRPEIIELE